MRTRNLWLVFTVTMLLGMATFAYAGDNDGDDAEGKVVRISGKKVTVKESSGKEVTVEVKDLKGIKVGDEVEIDDCKVKKMGAKKKSLDID